MDCRLSSKAVVTNKYYKVGRKFYFISLYTSGLQKEASKIHLYLINNVVHFTYLVHIGDFEHWTHEKPIRVESPRYSI